MRVALRQLHATRQHFSASLRYHAKTVDYARNQRGGGVRKISDLSFSDSPKVKHGQDKGGTETDDKLGGVDVETPGEELGDLGTELR